LAHAEVSAFAFADFTARCGVDRKLMRREGQRLAKLAAAQSQAADYEGEAERAFVQGIADFVAKQAERLTQLVADAARWKDKYL
jgi:serine/threonine-protein kinase HipA